jgi:hypothetical protein
VSGGTGGNARDPHLRDFARASLINSSTRAATFGMSSAVGNVSGAATTIHTVLPRS